MTYNNIIAHAIVETINASMAFGRLSKQEQDFSLEAFLMPFSSSHSEPKRERENREGEQEKKAKQEKENQGKRRLGAQS